MVAVALGCLVVIIGITISAQEEGKTLHHMEVQTLPKTLFPGEGSSLRGCPLGLQGSQDLGCDAGLVLASYMEGKGNFSAVGKNEVSP